MKIVGSIVIALFCLSFLAFTGAGAGEAPAGGITLTDPADTAAGWIGIERFRKWYTALTPAEKLAVVKFVSSEALEDEKKDPETEAEFRRYEKTIRDSVEKLRNVKIRIEETVRINRGRVERNTIIEKYRPELSAIVGEMIDEDIRHRRRMLEIVTANRNAIIRDRLEAILETDAARGTGEQVDGRERAGRSERTE